MHQKVPQGKTEACVLFPPIRLGTRSAVNDSALCAALSGEPVQSGSISQVSRRCLTHRALTYCNMLLRLSGHFSISDVHARQGFDNTFGQNSKF
jgi:hypothetical protein